MQKILLCLRQTWSISRGSYPLNSRHHAASLKFALFQPYFMVAKPGSWNQHEIGHRILKVQKFCSGTAVQIGLHWPSVSTRILSRKLSKRLSSHKDHSEYQNVAMEDVYNCSIIQQCGMLEATLGTTALAKCFDDPPKLY